MKGLVVLLLLLSTTSALHDDHETSPSPHFGPCHRLNTQTPGTCIDLNNLVCSQTPLIGHCPGPATIRCCQGEITAKSASRASNPHNSASPAQPPALQPREAPQGGEVVPAAGKTGSFPSGGSLTGRAFFKEVCKMSDSALTACAQQVYRPTCEGGQAVKFGVEREIAFVRAFLAGNVPAFLNALKPVQLSDASGALKVTVFVTPDVLSVGTNEDYVRLSLSPYAGALIGDKFGMTMPTKAVVQAEYATPGAVKIPAKPLDYKGGQTSCAYLWNTNVYMSGALSGGVGALVAGHRKEPIISAYCAAHDNKLDFYGWYKPEGVPWQTNPAHAALYSDYSHGLRLMSKTAEVTENGETSTRDVWELLRDAKYAAVLNKGGGGAFDAAKCYRDDSHSFKDALYAAFE